MFPPLHASPSRGRSLAAAFATLALAGCAAPRGAIDSQETFDSGTTYSRTYAARDAHTCEAARRTLLSQGYVIQDAGTQQVRAKKQFQPAHDTHVEVEFTVVCAREGYGGVRTIAFVNARQDRFALKKSTSSASVGLPAFGALSLPFTGSDEAMVKVASATIANAPFYDRFFKLLERYLEGDPGQPVPAEAPEPPDPVDTPASAPR